MTYKELKDSLEFVSNEKIKLLRENELLREELKELVDGINKLFNNVMALETIYRKESEDIEEI